MKVFITASSSSFIVIDSKRTVSDVSQFIRSSSFYWYVFTLDLAFYVFSRDEARQRLSSANAGRQLVVALKLQDMPSNVTLRTGTRQIDLPVLPKRAGSSRLVFVTQSRNDGPVVSAIGVLNKSKQSVRRTGLQEKQDRNVTSISPSRQDVSVNALRTFGGHAGGRGGIRGIKKSVAKKAAAKKAVTSGSHPVQRPKSAAPRRKDVGFSFGGYNDLAEVPKKKPSKKTASFETVKIFYATDRKLSNGNSRRARYLNQLETPAKLHYGVCRVTIPSNHRLGKLETPSIWKFWKLDFKENSEKHFTVSDCNTKGRSQFLKELKATIEMGVPKAAFVFIHGYNVAFDDAAKRTAQLARDMKFPGAPVLYSWASAAHTTKYSKDEEIIGLTQGRLQLFLEDLRDRTGAEVVHVIAHSMGNRALLQALKLIAAKDAVQTKFKQIVLTAPDVPRIEVEGLLHAANSLADRVTLYASNKDKALRSSKLLHANPRLGYVYGVPYFFTGVDSIDASRVHTDFMGHSVFSTARSVLGDLSELLLHGAGPANRFALQPLNTPNGICWSFKP